MASQEHIPFSIRLIRSVCKPDLVEEIEGNLIEYRQVNDSALSWFQYWIQVASYLRPSMLKKLKIKNNTTAMFQFNPLLALRSLFNQGINSVINIGGFSMGLFICILLFFYVRAELSVDSFHANGEEIYRVKRTNVRNGNHYQIGVTSGFYAKALSTDYPEIVKSTMRAYPQDALITFDDQHFYEDHLLFADAAFFEFFSYPLIEGNVNNVLAQPNSAVISKQHAIKYFGDDSPIGKTITVDHDYSFIISGVFDEAQEKSHLEFDIVLSIDFFERFEWFKDKWSNGLITYVQIEDPKDAERMAAQLPDFMMKYFGDDFEQTGSLMGLEIEPLSEVYFNKEIQFDVARHGDLDTLFILMMVGCGVLFIACFNYINLSLAQSFKRAKEVSIRKVLGVDRFRLMLQFVGESIIVLLAATAIAIAASALTQPFLENYFSVQLVMDWWQSGAVAFILALLAVILLIATIYPALMMAAIPSIKILRGGKLSNGRGVTSQRTLVTAQFAISIFLIAATLLILSQLDYVLNKPLGFQKDAVVIIDMNNTDIRNKSELFKDELRQSQYIQQISSMSGEPGGFHDGTVLEFVGQEGNHALRTVFTDHYYLSLFDIPVVAGRNFSEDIQSDETAVIFNQSALDALNMTADEVVGQKVVIPYFGDEERRVIGVADDFHFSTLKDKIEPMIIAGGSFHRKFAVKLHASNLYDGLQEIESKWEQMAPNDPIQYRFLDEAWFQLYEKEHQQASVFKALSGIALFLCCIGIFGLVSFTAQQRQKEFGIRKVLGASIAQILSLISREFVLLILAGAIIGLPLSWYFIDGWLTDFSYRIGLTSQWPLFILSGIAVLIITLLTIGLKTYRTSIMNPSESIRYE